MFFRTWSFTLCLLLASAAAFEPGLAAARGGGTAGLRLSGIVVERFGARIQRAPATPSAFESTNDGKGVELELARLVFTGNGDSYYAVTISSSGADEAADLRYSYNANPLDLSAGRSATFVSGGRGAQAEHVLRVALPADGKPRGDTLVFAIAAM